MSSKVHIILIIFISIVIEVYSAEKDSTTYFYKKTISEESFLTSKNLIKTDLISIIDGNVPIIWEHKFSDIFSLEGGLGIIIPIGNNRLNNIINFELNPDYIVKKIGGSALLEFRYHPEFFKSQYFCLKTRIRSYDHLLVSEMGLGVGFSFKLFNYTIEPEAYMTPIYENNYGANTSFKYNYYGPNFNDLNLNLSVKENFHIIPTLAFKIGYTLK